VVDDLGARKDVATSGTRLQRSRAVAWLAIVIADAGLLAWAAMAALIPQHLPGPHSASIVRDGYEGFTSGSWSDLVDRSPATADFIVLVFRMFGVYGVAFSLLAIAIAATAFRRGERWAWWALLVGNTIAYGAPITYDLIVRAVGPFEMLEYVAIALVYAALAVTAPALWRAPPSGGRRAPASLRGAPRSAGAG
jgi:hypothetical protein